MRVKLIMVAFCACTCLVQRGMAGTGPAEILQYYREANRLFFSPNPTTASDDRALELFGRIIHEFEKDFMKADTLLFFSYIRQGVLLEVKNKHAAAHKAYLKAIDCKGQLPQLKDSVLFPVYLYIGSTSYHLNNYDSARLFLDKAEMLIEQYPNLQDKERLYNSLGALCYESGNYHQSRNYFTKALELTRKTRPWETASIVNFQNNIAACLNKLEMYPEALAIYHSIVKQRIFSSHIYQNMGNAYCGLGEYEKALHYFRKADPGKAPGVKNEMAYAYFRLRKFDSAAHYLDKTLLDYNTKKGPVNRVEKGVNHLYRAELLVVQDKIHEALLQLQQAILCFSNGFNRTSIYVNPEDFTGNFASYKLFEALSRKAMAFKKLHERTADIKDLLASRYTSEAAISLLKYIERSYETDDARLFLKKNTQSVYSNALNTCLELYSKSGNKLYLEKAFVLTEQNKASVLAINVNEKSIKRKQGIPEHLMQLERNLRFKIARLNLKSDQAGPGEQQALATEKANYEIELSVLLSRYERINDYYNVKYNDEAPSLPALQSSLKSNQAVISFFAADSTLHAFVVTNSSFDHIALANYRGIEQQLMNFMTQLRTIESGRKYKAAKEAASIYRALISPLGTVAHSKDEWIIIPDGLLHYLPFEALQERADGPYLLESKVISYHFSAEMLRLALQRQQHVANYEVLAFAPFAGNVPGGTMAMQSLPSSMMEIDRLPGNTYHNKAATRETFIKDANHFPIIHLATHAVSNLADPGSSFISFYPSGSDSGKLYLEELYGIEMDSVAMVIISACESGDGRLVNSEGVMSLSRGFAYAGCRSTVTSLWKANDRSTAIILQKFHEYLQKGYSKQKALQRAKSDYIQEEGLNTTPNYWAHLVLFGETGTLTRERKGQGWFWIPASLACTMGLLWGTYKIQFRKKERKSTYS